MASEEDPESLKRTFSEMKQESEQTFDSENIMINQDRDQDSDSDVEPLPPVPQAPRHFTQAESATTTPNPAQEEGEVESEGEITESAVIEQSVPTSPDWNQSKGDKEYKRTFQGCSLITDYEVDKVIGEGTFGLVTIGKHTKTGDTVALKKVIIHSEKEGVVLN